MTFEFLSVFVQGNIYYNGIAAIVNIFSFIFLAMINQILNISNISGYSIKSSSL